MRELRDEAGTVWNTPVIDASVAIFCQSNADLRNTFMRENIMFRNGIETYHLPDTVPALEGQVRVF